MPRPPPLPGFLTNLSEAMSCHWQVLKAPRVLLRCRVTNAVQQFPFKGDDPESQTEKYLSAVATQVRAELALDPTGSIRGYSSCV